MEDIVMIFTEERTATIKFGSIFKSAEYVENTKVIIVKFESSKEAASFKHIIMFNYGKIFKLDTAGSAIIVKANDGTTITNVTIDNNLSCLSISLNYTCYCVG